MSSSKYTFGQVQASAAITATNTVAAATNFTGTITVPLPPAAGYGAFILVANNGQYQWVQTPAAPAKGANQAYNLTATTSNPADPSAPGVTTYAFTNV